MRITYIQLKLDLYDMLNKSFSKYVKIRFEVIGRNQFDILIKLENWIRRYSERERKKLKQL